MLNKFEVWSDNQHMGFFYYDDLPITIHHFPERINSNYDIITICDYNDPHCCTTIEFMGLNCAGGNCEMDNLLTHVYDCDTVSGEFFVDLNFTYANTSDSFYVYDYANGNTLGKFAYTDLPATIGPLSLDTQFNFTQYTFQITDVAYPDCTLFDGILFYGCECLVEIDNIYEIECINDNHISFHISYDYYNTPGDSFYIVNDVHSIKLGPYAYADVPVFVDNVEIAPPLFTALSIEDATAPNSCASNGYTFVFPNCGGNNNCELDDIEYAVFDCDSLSEQYFLEIDFAHANTSDSFYITGNGAIWGKFAYVDLPVSIGPLNLNVQYSFKIKDAEYPDCSINASFYLPTCGCYLGHLHVYDKECVDSTYVSFYFDFDAINPASDSFYLVTHDNSADTIGTYAYSDLPIFIDSFAYPSDIVIFQAIDIANNGSNNCISPLHTVLFPDCDNSNCELDDLIIEAHPCDNNNHFMVDLNFAHANTSDSLFLYVNGNYYGTYAYDDLYFTIGPFAANTQHEFLIKDVDDTSCKISGGIGPVNCGGNCEIGTYVTEAHPCGPAGQYLLDIDFYYTNTSDSFLLYLDNGFYGVYAYNDLPITIGPLNGNQKYDILIKDAVYMLDCKLEFEIKEDCNSGGPCEIEDFKAEAFCDGGKLYVEFEFDASNVSDSFVVQSCYQVAVLAYQNAGSYIVELDPDLLTCGFGNVVPFGVYDLQNGLNCGATAFIEIPSCTDPCDIWNLMADITDCEDGQFYVVIDFEYENTSTSFKVQGNGINYGTYSYSNLPVTIGPFNGDGQTVYELVVKDVNHPDCSDFVTFGPVDCGECELSELETDVFCQGDDVLVEFTFEAENTGDSFQLISCLPVGTFAYNANNSYVVTLPDSVLGCSANGVVPFGIIDLENGFSCSIIEFIEIPDCQDICQIYDITVEKHPCDMNEEFLVDIDFLYQNTGSAGFLVFQDNQFFGPFSYNNLPVTIGPFAGDGSSYDFLILDLADPTCFNYYNLGEVDCNGPCEILNLDVKINCDPATSGKYTADINFDVDNPDNDFFEVWINNEYQGFYSLLNTTFPLVLTDLDIGSNATALIKVCINDNPNCCATVSAILPNCFNVWPGDTDNNNIALNWDLLNIGLAFEQSGPKRLINSIQWQAQLASNWNKSFKDGTNYKHADCDGDGVVDFEDIDAIQDNYNETHGQVEPMVSTIGTQDDPPLYIDFPNTMPSNMPFTVPIVLGTQDKPVADIYGLAFTIEFDPKVIKNAKVELANSWFGTLGMNAAELTQSFSATGSVDVALTRVNHNTVSGHGIIGYFIGITDDLAGLVMPDGKSTVTIDRIKSIDYQEEKVPLYTPETQFQIPTSVSDIILDKISIYPNPTESYFHIQNNTGKELLRIQVTDIQGRIVTTLAPQQGSLTKVNASAWRSGMYFIRLETSDGVAWKKIEKLE